MVGKGNYMAGKPITLLSLVYINLYEISSLLFFCDDCYKVHECMQSLSEL